jgi:serine/threonine-protein phosphatase 6 regulatory ankyrin repeat subunit B
MLAILKADDAAKLDECVRQGDNIDQGLTLDGVPSILQSRPTLLQVAAFFGADRCFQLLQMSNASLTSTDEAGRAAVHFASAGGSSVICDALDAAGCDFTALSPGLVSCLHYACEYGRVDLVRRFNARNFPLDQPDEAGLLPVHYAARAPTVDVIAYLSEQGCDLDARVRTHGLTTPFLEAYRTGALNVLRFLVTSQVDTDVALAEDRTPLQEAAYRGDSGIVQVLLLSGRLDINHADAKLGWTALHWAAQEGHADVCRLLIERGADVNAVTKNQFSPTLAAANNEHPELVKMLLAAGGKYRPGTDEEIPGDGTV